VKKLSSAYNAALWAMEKEFKKVNQGVSQRIHKLRREVEKEFRWSPALLPRHSPCLVVVHTPGRSSAGKGTHLRTPDVPRTPQLGFGYVDLTAS